MICRALATFLLVTTLAGHATPARAATYDPELTWRTVETKHFRITFHQGEEKIADDLSEACERIYAELSQELAWKLKMKVEVVLVDPTDRANGFATSVPYNAITIYVTAPQEDSTLSLYEDWTEAIFTHELTHVLHLETNGGVMSVARAIAGRIVTSHQWSPLWSIEGLATFQETRHTEGGRGRNPFVDMIERASVLENGFPPLGNLDGIQVALPSGNLRYLFGQDFMQFVADDVGENVWTRWTHGYGRHIPFILPTERVFGAKLQQLYRRWRDAVRERTLHTVAAIEAEGVREGRRISDDRSSCSAPSIARDDSWMVWSCYDLRTGSSLWKAEADGSGPKKLKQDMGAKTFTWRGDGNAFVYAGTHTVNRFNTWSDVYLYDLRSGRIKSLTTGARARDPDFSPDGSELVVVTNQAQTTRLELLTIDQQRRVITPPDEPGYPQYATPRFAPNGEVLAVSIWEAGRRDLWLLGRDGTRLRRLTADVANDRDPTWSADGRTLYFGSDRSGVPNIYALDIDTEHLWQVTNVRTGASKPTVSPDGTRMAYEQYSHTGWEVRLLALDRSQWIDRGPLPAPLHDTPSLSSLLEGTSPPARVAWERWGSEEGTRHVSGGPAPTPAGPAQDQGGTDSYDQAKVRKAFGEEEDYPFRLQPRRYSPARSLIPRYWIPGIAFTQPLPGPTFTQAARDFATLPAPFQFGGAFLSVSTGATDPLRHVAWSAAGTWRSDIGAFGGGGSVTINRWLPVFSFGANTAVNPVTYLVTDAWQALTDGEPEFTSEDLRTAFYRDTQAFFSFAWPFTVRSTFQASYVFTDRNRITDIDDFTWEPSLALRGTLGNLTLGYRYAWGQPTATAVSPEDARTIAVSATLSAPFLGTIALQEDGTQVGVTQVLLSADWREYVVNPLAANHVLALRAGVGVALGGADQFLGNYQLGGNGVGSLRALRGYRFGADRGDSYWLAGAEYRFPIWRMDRGFGTVPAFFRYLSGQVFVEAGNAFALDGGVDDALLDTLVGVGAELRFNAFVLWAVPVDLRVGYATGLTQGGFRFDDARTVYILFTAGGG